MNRITLVHGDITTLSVDAIVNPANKSLLGGGGLDGKIHKKAGSLMKSECIQINQEKGGCAVGNAEVTTAGNLPAKYLIHAVPPRWLGGEKNEPQLLCNAHSNALLKANQVQAKTVSFPNLGTGIYKYPLQQAAEFAIGSIMMTLPSCEAVDEVFFVCYEKDNYEIYKEILENLYDENIQIEITAIAK